MINPHVFPGTNMQRQNDASVYFSHRAAHWLFHYQQLSFMNICLLHYSPNIIISKRHFGNMIEVMSGSVLRPDTKGKEGDELLLTGIASDDGPSHKKRYYSFHYWCTIAPWGIHGTTMSVDRESNYWTRSLLLFNSNFPSLYVEFCIQDTLCVGPPQKLSRPWAMDLLCVLADNKMLSSQRRQPAIQSNFITEHAGNISFC